MTPRTDPFLKHLYSGNPQPKPEPDTSAASIDGHPYACECADCCALAPGLAELERLERLSRDAYDFEPEPADLQKRNPAVRRGKRRRRK